MSQRAEIAAELRRVADMISFEVPLPRRHAAPAAVSAVKAKKTRRPMSAEAKAKIAEAQRRRWAKQKKAKPVKA